MIEVIIYNLTKFTLKAIKMAHENKQHKHANSYVLFTLGIFATVLLILLTKN